MTVTLCMHALDDGRNATYVALDCWVNPAVLEIRYSTNYRYYCSTGNDLRRGSTSLKHEKGSNIPGLELELVQLDIR